jgi:hypothetical protein
LQLAQPGKEERIPVRCFDGDVIVSVGISAVRLRGGNGTGGEAGLACDIGGHVCIRIRRIRHHRQQGCCVRALIEALFDAVSASKVDRCKEQKAEYGQAQGQLKQALAAFVLRPLPPNPSPVHGSSST